MRGRTLAFLGLFVWTGGCATQAESIDDDTSTDTGDSENASGGGSSTGGDANNGGTSFLAEGEILLGSCLFTPPGSTQCQDYLTRPEYGEPEESGGEQICLGRHVGDTSSFVEWRGGEHCPLEGAALACKYGVEITYSYSDTTLTAVEAEERCGYGVPVYFRE